MCHSPSLGLCGIAEKTEFIGGVADHVHLLLSMPTTMAMAKAIPLIKRGSSAWNHQITSGTSEHINRPSGIHFSLVSRHFVPGYFRLIPPGQDTLFRCRIFLKLS
ncbi:MAG: transposase [Verrucomicrobia bacterium]|nr:transposase [Verrucomicrobiota bacterium]